MTSHRDATSGARSGDGPVFRRRLTCVKSGALLLALALTVGGLGLAGPAQAAPAHRSEEPAYGHPAALDGEVERGAVLPFGRLDLAILMLGGALLAAVAAGVPRLLRPLRQAAPLLAGTVTTSDAVLARIEQGAAAHVTA